MAVPKKNQVIGLDIGSHSIKLVEIEQTSKGRILRNFGIIGLPHDAIVEGSIKEMEIVASAIKTLYRNLKVKNRNVATSISGYSVIVKKIEISEREESELEESIQSEAEQYIPFDINDVNLDYDILEIGDEEQNKERKSAGGKMGVMLVAAKKEVVQDYVSLLQLSGLNPAVLDVDAFALQNAFEASAAEPDGCYALVNVGAQELGINAIKDGVSMFSRDSSYGGNQITEAIMSQFDLSFEEAEKIKLGGDKPESGKSALEEIFTSVISEWVQEIKRALDFLATSYPSESIQKIMLGGGSSRIPGFRKYLELETNLPVEDINPFANLLINEKAFDSKYLSYMASQAAIAVGLALRGIGDK
jgi:type IV pilus assembly protein PilM